MNKKANRRAFFVCLFIGLMYAFIAFRLPEKINIARISGERKVMPSSVMGTPSKPNHDISLPEVPASIFKNQEVENQPSKAETRQADSQQAPAYRHVTRLDGKIIEPSLFIAPLLVAYAIKEGFIERDGLILVQKEGYNTFNCKKPIDILRDKDEHGLKIIARLIGKRQSLDFLKLEGIILTQDIDSEKIITGVGYSIEKDKLLSLYSKYVSEDFQDLFPFAMHGNGNIVEQTPRAFERTKGEAECVIYGRTAR
jgi:hypothetical protein